MIHYGLVLYDRNLYIEVWVCQEREALLVAAARNDSQSEPIFPATRGYQRTTRWSEVAAAMKSGDIDQKETTRLGRGAEKRKTKQLTEPRLGTEWLDQFSIDEEKEKKRVAQEKKEREAPEKKRLAQVYRQEKKEREAPEKERVAGEKKRAAEEKKERLAQEAEEKKRLARRRSGLRRRRSG